MSRSATPFLPDRGRQLAQTVSEEIPEERVVSVCRQQPPVASHPRTQPSAKNAPSTISASTLPAATFCTIFTIDRPGIAHRQGTPVGTAFAGTRKHERGFHQWLRNPKILT